MFYKNIRTAKKLRLKQLSISNFRQGMNANYDENVLPINYPKVAFNIDNLDGTLKPGLGVNTISYDIVSKLIKTSKTLNISETLGVLATWVYSYYDKGLNDMNNVLILYCSNKKMYFHYLNENTQMLTEIIGLEFTTIPNAIRHNINGDDVMVFSTVKDGMWVWGMAHGQNLYKVEGAPKMVHMSIHAERLFAIIERPSRELWFSDDLDITNWSLSLSEAGFIQMVDERGKLLKVLSMNDYVYVFREFGISKVSGHGDQSEFSVTHPYLTSGRIFEDTITQIGDKVFFLSQEGLFAFDGYNVSKIDWPISKMIRPNYRANACYNNGKYYLSCLMDFSDNRKIFMENFDFGIDKKNNALIEFDIKNGDIKILRGVPIEYMTPINTESYSFVIAIVWYNQNRIVGKIDNSGSVFDFVLHKIWETPVTDFGEPLREKVIKEIRVNNKESVYLQIHTEKEDYLHYFPGSDLGTVKRVAIKGREFKFVFDCEDKEFDVKSLEVVYGVL